MSFGRAAAALRERCGQPRCWLVPYATLANIKKANLSTLACVEAKDTLRDVA